RTRPGVEGGPAGAGRLSGRPGPSAEVSEGRVGAGFRGRIRPVVRSGADLPGGPSGSRPRRSWVDPGWALGVGRGRPAGSSDGWEGLRSRCWTLPLQTDWAACLDRAPCPARGNIDPIIG